MTFLACLLPSLNACCLPVCLLPSLILMIYETAIGEIYATFGTYGWKAPGGTSLLWICHKNVFTLGPLLSSRKLQNAWVFFCLFNLGLCIY